MILEHDGAYCGGPSRAASQPFVGKQGEINVRASRQLTATKALDVIHGIGEVGKYEGV